MQVPITRIDTALPLPAYHTDGAVGFDVYSRIDADVPPGGTGHVPANLIIAVPDGYALIIAARSSLSKRGLQLTNGIGVIDQDFHGPDDELVLMVRNFTDSPVHITRGERLAQGLLVPVAHAEWIEGPPQKKNSRGGYGSTGPL